MGQPSSTVEQMFDSDGRRIRMPAIKTSMNEVDFVEGILTVAALRGHLTFSVAESRLDRAMAVAYRRLQELLADDDMVEIEFEVQPDQIFGDSPTVRGAINVAVADRHTRRINPTFRLVETTLVIEPEAADVFLRRLPGGPELYHELANTFLDSYGG